ncbi:hypothetical protein T484DRAFT_2025153 [Baffinella frigidus]|nr:hypothetical protein T484DRAFT_2025153 [Cryptophyta sp. CCMP2293]
MEEASSDTVAPPSTRNRELEQRVSGAHEAQEHKEHCEQGRGFPADKSSTSHPEVPEMHRRVPTTLKSRILVSAPQARKGSAASGSGRKNEQGTLFSETAALPPSCPSWRFWSEFPKFRRFWTDL